MAARERGSASPGPLCPSVPLSVAGSGRLATRAAPSRRGEASRRARCIVGRGLSEEGEAAARRAAGMMVSLIRRHPGCRRAPLPGSRLSGLRRPLGAVLGGAVAGRSRAGHGGGRPAAEACRLPAA